MTETEQTLEASIPYYDENEPEETENEIEFDDESR